MNRKKNDEQSLVDAYLERSVWPSDNRWVTDDGIRPFKRIESVVKKIGKSKDVLFYERAKRKGGKLELGCDPLGMELVRLIGTDHYALRREFADHDFNPYISMYFKSYDALPLLLNLKAIDAAEVQELVRVLNGFVNEIRNALGQKEFRAKVSNFNRGARKNFSGTMEGIAKVFKKRGRLLIARVDFFMLEQHKLKVSSLEFKHYWDQLLYRLKSHSSFKARLMWCVTKREYGMLRGFHIHGLFFFDGSLVKSGFYVAKQIGELWKTEITGGRGHYYNCNADIEGYFYRGIGMVHRSDERALIGITKIISYLTKVDYLMKIAFNDGCRNFRRSEILKIADTPEIPKKKKSSKLTLHELIQSKVKPVLTRVAPNQHLVRGA